MLDLQCYISTIRKYLFRIFLSLKRDRFCLCIKVKIYQLSIEHYLIKKKGIFKTVIVLCCRLKKDSKIRAIVAFDLTVRRIFALKRVNNGPTFVSITTSFHSIFLSIDYRSPEIKVEINTYHMHPFQTVKTTTQLAHSNTRPPPF